MKSPVRSLNLVLVWVLFSLLAIVYIGQRPYLGLAIAVVGGVVLGVLSFLYYEPTAPTDSEICATPHEDGAVTSTLEYPSS